MPWIVQSASDGPVIVNDLNMTFHKGQARDVDLFGGRENVERSNDLKVLILKGYLKEVRKDIPQGTIQPNNLAKLETAISEVNQGFVQQAESIKAVQDGQKTVQEVQVQMQQEMAEHKKAVMDVLAEVRAFAEQFPLQVKTIAAAMTNIQAERAVIADKRVAIHGSDMDEADMKAQDRILEIKEKKLEKNLKNLGHTVSESAGDDVTASLKALEEIGLPPPQKK